MEPSTLSTTICIICESFFMLFAAIGIIYTSMMVNKYPYKNDNGKMIAGITFLLVLFLVGPIPFIFVGAWAIAAQQTAWQEARKRRMKNLLRRK